jgi:hypothetical protein
MYTRLMGIEKFFYNLLHNISNYFTYYSTNDH